MNNEYQFTASELIHLFVDGEADQAQQALLFSLLATDTGLQEQFRAAVFMQQTLEQVRASAVPPAQYTTELFARAGFATSAATAASGWAGIPPAAKSIILSLCSAVMGAGLAILLLFPYFQNATSQTGAPAVSVAVPDTTYNQRMHSARASELYVPGFPGPVGQANPQGMADNAETTYDANRNSIPASASGETLRAQQSRMLAENTVRTRLRTSIYSESDNGVQDNPDTFTNTALENPAANRADAPVEQSEETALDATRWITESSLTSLAPQATVAISHNRPERVRLSDLPVAEEVPTVVLYLKNTQALSWYPMRDIPVSTMEENLMFGGLYYLSAEHAVGAEVGRELLPLYRFADNLQIRNNTLLWGGAVYQYQPSALVIANTMEPFVRLGLGGTEAGPMGKIMLGMRLQTSDILSASIGLESSTLVYRRHTTIGTTGKLGFTVSVEAEF